MGFLIAFGEIVQRVGVFHYYCSPQLITRLTDPYYCSNRYFLNTNKYSWASKRKLNFMLFVFQ